MGTACGALGPWTCSCELVASADRYVPALRSRVVGPQKPMLDVSVSCHARANSGDFVTNGGVVLFDGNGACRHM
eukprot:4329490-Prymnesium_polylepis.1